MPAPRSQPADAGAPPAAGADTAVECEDLVVRYGTRTAVDGLSLRAEKGRVLAVLGPNGAGKTSTVETLEGFRRRTSGTVRVLGLDPATDHRALVARVGVMLQRGGVYPTMGPRQALRLSARYYDRPEDPDGLLERLGLGAVAATPWRRLSGGEQQRLGLALALIGRPEVLFLDEPTAGVDPEGRLAIRQVVAERRHDGCCVVLTTHELAEAERMADEVLIVDRGRVVAGGTPAALAASAGDDAVRFTAPAGLDRAALAAAAGVGTPDVEEAQAGRYLVRGPVTPARVAAVAQWLADAGLPVTDLRTTGGSLEEVYLRLVGAGAEPDPSPGGGPAGGDGRSAAGAGPSADGASRSADSPSAGGQRRPGRGQARGAGRRRDRSRR